MHSVLFLSFRNAGVGGEESLRMPMLVAYTDNAGLIPAMITVGLLASVPPANPSKTGSCS